MSFWWETGYDPEKAKANEPILPKDRIKYDGQGEDFLYQEIETTGVLQ